MDTPHKDRQLIYKQPILHLIRKQMQNQIEHDRQRDVLRSLHVFQISSFLASCHHLLPIIYDGWRKQRHSRHLPMNVVSYLCALLHLEAYQVDACWSKLHHLVTSQDTQTFQHLIAYPHSSVESVRILNSLSLRKSILHAKQQ